jgi:hypothetical protein
MIAHTCHICQNPDRPADEVEYTYGPTVLATIIACEECADDYWPPAPTAWDRRTAWD